METVSQVSDDSPRSAWKFDECKFWNEHTMVSLCLGCTVLVILPILTADLPLHYLMTYVLSDSLTRGGSVQWEDTLMVMCVVDGNKVAGQ